jgi:hypothetical protein
MKQIEEDTKRIITTIDVVECKQKETMQLMTHMMKTILNAMIEQQK